MCFKTNYKTSIDKNKKFIKSNMKTIFKFSINKKSKKKILAILKSIIQDFKAFLKKAKKLQKKT